MTKLNLGCGQKHMTGYINVDEYAPADQFVNLNVFPWPWADNSIDEIYSENWLEHVQDFEKTVLEMHRILKPGGVLHCEIPHCRSPYDELFYHKQRFTTHSFRCFEEALPWVWGGRGPLFRQEYIRVKYRFIRPVFRIVFEFLANRYLNKWEFLGLPLCFIIYQGRKI